MGRAGGDEGQGEGRHERVDGPERDGVNDGRHAGHEPDGVNGHARNGYARYAGHDARYGPVDDVNDVSWRRYAGYEPYVRHGYARDAGHARHARNGYARYAGHGPVVNDGGHAGDAGDAFARADARNDEEHDAPNGGADEVNGYGSKCYRRRSCCCRRRRRK